MISYRYRLDSGKYRDMNFSSYRSHPYFQASEDCCFASPHAENKAHPYRGAGEGMVLVCTAPLVRPMGAQN